MAMFCRKRLYTGSPPAAEVTVKRCASCPQSCKPVLAERRHRERLLLGIFRNKKPGKRIYRGKWKSYDDVRPRALKDQHLGALPLIEEGAEIFENPVYQPPGDETPLCSHRMDSLALPTTQNKALDHHSSASSHIQDPRERREEVTEQSDPTHQEPRKQEVSGQSVSSHQEPRKQEVSGQSVSTHQETWTQEVKGQTVPAHQEPWTQEVSGERTPTHQEPRMWQVSEQAGPTHQEPRTQEVAGQLVPSHQEPKTQEISGQTVPTHQEPSLFERLMKKGSYRQRQKGSKFVHTQPLYQDYCVHYSKGGPGQSPFILSVNSSLALAGNTSPTFLRSYPSDAAPRHYTSLWQELPEVKERGITETMTMQRKQLQEAMFEVLVSEASYQRSLSVAVNHFQKSQSLSDCLVTSDKHTLFSNLPSVRQVSERFLLDLEEGLEKDIFLSDLGDRVLRHCPVFHRVYIPYVTNQMYQEKLMQQLVCCFWENGMFLQVLQQLEEQPVCKRQLLKSFLALPFQRITRLKILLENILKLAQSDFRLVSSIGDAASAVGQIVTQCNEGVRSMMQTEELVLLEKRMDFQNTKAVPLISRGRVLVQHGELIRIFFQDLGSGHRSGLTTKPIYLHLFSDLLLLSNKTDTGRFLVTDYARRGQVKADHVKAKALGLPSLVFLLRLTQNHLGLSCDLVLQAPSE
ncbi:rho guanine nucleotide exchange factor 5-like [Lithobates pipiens]